MQIDIVNPRNEKVGSLELADTVFGGRLRNALVWQSVVHEQAERRRGTHATKNRALVSGSGKKPWRQKGTGRARVGEIRNPLWRKGGTVFGPQPRSYGFDLPKKVQRGALRSALAARLQEGAVVVVDGLAADEVSTKKMAAVLKGLGVAGKTLIVDVHPEEKLVLSTRNLAGVRLVPSRAVTARDVMDCGKVLLTRAAAEKLQQVLGN
jgi:large subunit ribosomal protein L4